MKQLILPIITCLLPLLQVFSQNSNPNLSDKRITELQDSIANKAATVLPDTSYVPPAGARYKEIRSVEPSVPPVIIDIAGNLENKRTFKLSDIASSVRYIIMQNPPGSKYKRISEIISDDEHIFIHTGDGLFCYSTNGQYMYPAYLNQILEEPKTSTTRIGTKTMVITKDGRIDGIVGNVDLLNGKLFFRTSEESTGRWFNVYDVKEMDSKNSFNVNSKESKNLFTEPTVRRKITGGGYDGRSSYLWLDDESLFTSHTLTNILIKGDTLCKFSDYDLPTIKHVICQVGNLPN